MHIEEYNPAAATDLQRSLKIKATWPSLQGEDGGLMEGSTLCSDFSGVLSSANVQLLGHFFQTIRL